MCKAHRKKSRAILLRKEDTESAYDVKGESTVDVITHTASLALRKERKPRWEK